jgi:hypothetical protein
MYRLMAFGPQKVRWPSKGNATGLLRAIRLNYWPPARDPFVSAGTPSPLGKAITIDEERIKNHLDRVVRGSVEETLNALLDAEADRLCNAQR